MSNVGFQLPKFKIQEDPYLNEQIRCHGMMIGFYDTSKEDHEQHQAYQLFKEMVFVTLPPKDHLNEDGEFKLYAAQKGYAMLNAFPKEYRVRVLDSLHNLQSYAKARKPIQTAENILLHQT